MKYIATIFTFLCISWCFSLQETKHIDLNNMSWLNNTNYQTGSVQEEDTKKNIYITGSIDSWFNISWQYISIISSWNNILYDQTFKLDVSKSLTRNYKLTHSPLYSWHAQWLQIHGQVSDIIISHLFLSDVASIHNEYLSEIKLCTPSYEEWIRYKPKTHTLTQWNQTYYLTYAKFRLDQFERTDPIEYNYQSEICFIKNDKIYYITISNPTHYRKDIVESLKFL